MLVVHHWLSVHGMVISPATAEQALVYRSLEALKPAKEGSAVVPVRRMRISTGVVRVSPAAARDVSALCPLRRVVARRRGHHLAKRSVLGLDRCGAQGG